MGVGVMGQWWTVVWMGIESGQSGYEKICVLEGREPLKKMEVWEERGVFVEVEAVACRLNELVGVDERMDCEPSVMMILSVERGGEVVEGAASM